MKNVMLVPEFWAALVGQVIGIMVLVGGLGAEEGEAMSKAIQGIIGGVLSLGTILGFIKAQGARKLAAVQLMVAKMDAVPADARALATAQSESASELLEQI